METFYEPLLTMGGMELIDKILTQPNGHIMVSGCIDTQKVQFAQAIAHNYKFKVIITNDETKARQIQEDSTFFCKNSVYYPAKDFIFYSADIHGSQIVGERLDCIYRIIKTLQSKDNSSLTVVTTIDGCADMLISLDKYINHTITFNMDDTVDVEKLAKDLVSIGYERCGMIESSGQFAIRGGIIDVFSHTDEVPVRIELWDDEIDSIRTFDVSSQRSIEKVKSYSVFPATECILTQDEIENGIEKIKEESQVQLKQLGIDKNKKDKSTIDAINRARKNVADLERVRDYSKFFSYFETKPVSFLEYFPIDETVFVLDEPNRLKERMELVKYEYDESMKNRLSGGYVLAGQTNMISGIDKIYAMLSKRKVIMLSALDYKPQGFSDVERMRVDARSISSYNNSFDYLVDDIKKYKRNKYKIILVCNSTTRALRIVEDLKERDIDAFFSEDYSKPLIAGTVMVTYGNIHNGFEYPLLGFVVITENDIFSGKKKKKVRKKKYEGKAIAEFNELNIGDYVVHENYGVGIYKGIEKIEVDGSKKDYIKIEYGDNSDLYVLVTQLDRLQKYAASDTEKKPKLNKLGTQDWNRTKSKVHGAVEEVAKDLVALYAARQNEKGYQFDVDTVWQKEFEEMFPYEETQDQLNAIEDTKRDMESPRIMDRLICGDVGYGKTEMAIRAAFKAVQEGKQVAYLVPTTILAQQIYNTFEQRMKNFPITVAQFSSFRTSKEIKHDLSELRKGFVDIAIGTHRLLSKDVEFKDLGLLIIDEEQRFGVTHKEKIKKLKNNIDVLTLSATPIPRTLHMSLVGIRDMSVLEEPPVDRLPIQTFVTEHNDEMIREAINRELARNGQVYYVYNRVRSIDEVALHLQELVPDANVAYAHGQMDKRMLEKIMYEFINGEIDVLVSTTIIETGVDISNVNTMIIEDADKFGLSQLYQLRGRVGRSNRTSYAFLLYRRDRMITEVAEKRLSAIREFSDLGSGFKIAMKDLEIRGAGNVLGKTQHGHMAAVGYDLYCKMLNQAVNELKGIKNEYAFETSVDLTVDAFIPSTYIKSEYQKLDIYKRIAGLENDEEMSDMKDELIDRYGSLPESAVNLLKIAIIKTLAHRIGIVEIKGGIDTTSHSSMWKTTISISPKAQIDGSKINSFVEMYRGAVIFKVEKEPLFIWRATRKKYSSAPEYIDGLRDLVDTMMDMLVGK